MTSHRSLDDADRVTSHAAANDVIEDRYRLISLLGGDDDSETWKAHDLRLNRDVSLSLFASAGGVHSAPEEIQRAVLARFSHLSAILDAGNHYSRSNGTWTFVVSPFVAATSDSVLIPSAVAVVVEADRPLPIGEWIAATSPSRTVMKSSAGPASSATFARFATWFRARARAESASLPTPMSMPNLVTKTP